MNAQELDGILEKASELKVFFEFGQKTLPALEEVGSFVQQIGPLVDGIRSLSAITSERLPKATAQLERVNLSSEKASNDILNTVDRMMNQVEDLKRQVRSHLGAENLVESSRDVHAAIDTIAAKLPADTDLTSLLSAWDLHRQSISALQPSSALSASLEQLSDDCTNVMMAQQVQDITGQQIASVIGLMQAVGDVLRRLVADIGEAAPVESPEPVAPADAAVPPQGFVGADERKRMVEALLAKARSGDLRSNP
ncbi:MAG: protein phosphatase CheZ [Bacteroidetes bacterium]|jgi:chemotaxis regulatin CheY-phosphate phosphatase CheZ|nr:protein phosphatase CheZ [Bacteroidota bacterium]